MDYFKIIVIILLIIICYKIFWLDCKTTEGFESANSNLDDGVAINALAQLARSLMSTGSTTIPGTLIVPGGLNLTAPLNAGLINANTSYFGSGKSKVQIGQGFRPDGACVYASDNTLDLGSSNNTVKVNGSLFIAEKNVGALLDSLQAQINGLKDNMGYYIRSDDIYQIGSPRKEGNPNFPADYLSVHDDRIVRMSGAPRSWFQISKG